MKMKIRRLAAFVLTFTLIAAFLPGCGKSEQAKKVVFKVNDEDVTLDEVWFYCKSIQEYYEQYYSSMFSSPDAWTSSYPVTSGDGTTEDSTLEDVAKRSAIKQIREIKIAAKHADDQGIVLNDDQKKAVKEQAESFMKRVTNKEIETMGISEELAEKVFTESAKVEALKDKMGEKEGIEISDEDAKTSTVYYIEFPIVGYDASGNAVQASEENQKKAKDDAEEALKRIQAGNDIATVAAAYGMGGTSGQVSVNSDTDLPDAVSKALDGLNDGEVYDKVIAATDGMYILKMISKVDQAATENRKEQLKSEKEQDLLEKQIKKWTKGDDFDYNKDVNWKYMDEIDFTADSTVSGNASGTGGVSSDGTSETTAAADDTASEASDDTTESTDDTTEAAGEQ